jgi:hypothetical protein
VIWKRLSRSQLVLLCEEKIQYIYVSAVNLSFSLPLLEENKQDYPPVLALPEARLYRVHCQQAVGEPGLRVFFTAKYVRHHRNQAW